MDNLNREAAEAVVSTDLVRRREAIDAIEYWHGIDASEALERLQEVDAVEVVRCRDCKWFDLSDPLCTITPVVYRCRIYGTYHTTGFFCSIGERKSEEDPSHPCADSVMMGD